MPIPQTLTSTSGGREVDAEIARVLGKVPAEAFKPCGSPDPATWGIGPYGFWTADHYSTSLATAVALVEERLPGSYVVLQHNYVGDPPQVEPWTARITLAACGRVLEQDGPSAPLALLRALFTVLGEG